MAAPAKRRNVEEEEQESDQDSEDMDEEEDVDEDEMVGQEMNVDFEAQTPSESDFHGIKRLLQQLFLKANVNLSAMTDLILGQNHVGSVIKQADDDDDEEEDDDEMDRDAVMEVFGITTVINVTDRLKRCSAEGDKPASDGDKVIAQMVDLLLAKSDSNGGTKQTSTLKSYLNNSEKQTGWMVNERFVNIPPQISLPLYDSLREEMHSACSKGQKFKFDYFLLLSKAFKEKGGKKKKEGEDFLIFANGEEELFKEESCFSFAFSVADMQADAENLGAPSDEDTVLEAWRVVMILPAEKMEVVAKKMTDLLGAEVEGKITALR